MFSDILVELAQSREVTMYELSQKTDIPQSLLSNYKNGKKKPALENIIKLADFFDVSTDYLLGRTDNPNISTESYIGGDNNGVQAIKNNGAVTISQSSRAEQQDEMTQELVKAFQSMSFPDKMEIMNAVLEKVKNKNI